MIEVTFLRPRHHGVAAEQAGSATFFAVPLHDRKDVIYSPDILTFEQLQAVADQLANGQVIGEIGEYEWRRE